MSQLKCTTCVWHKHTCITILSHNVTWKLINFSDIKVILYIYFTYYKFILLILNHKFQITNFVISPIFATQSVQLVASYGTQNFRYEWCLTIKSMT